MNLKLGDADGLVHVTQQVNEGPSSTLEHSCSCERNRSVEQFLSTIKPVLQVVGPLVDLIKSV